MAKKQQSRSRGGAFLTVITMLFARNYRGAVILVLSCLAAVAVSLLLAQQRGQGAFALIALVRVFWFVYGGMRANKRFDKDPKLTETERGVFKKLMDRSGFIVFLMIIVYIVMVGVVAALGWMRKSQIQNAGMMNNADYQQLLQDLQEDSADDIELPVDEQAGVDELDQPSDLPNS